MSSGKLVAGAAAALVIGLGALGATALARPLREQHAPVVRTETVAVDVSRLRALGLGETADVVQSAVEDELRSHPLASGGRIAVRIDGLSLASFAGVDGGGDTGGGSGGASVDYMQGEGLVLGAGGEVVRHVPIVMSLPSTNAGPYYLPGVDQRRVVELSRNFARWVERELG